MQYIHNVIFLYNHYLFYVIRLFFKKYSYIRCLYVNAFAYSTARMQIRFTRTQSENHVHVLYVKFYVIKYKLCTILYCLFYLLRYIIVFINLLIRLYVLKCYLCYINFIK